MKIEQHHLKPLSMGAAMLGSGGGGSTVMQERILLSVLQQGYEVQLVDIEDLEETDLIVPIAFMGAPLVAQEKIPSGLEASALLEMIRAEYGSVRHIILMPAEIGGANAFTPLWIGALHGLSVLNADSIGRAFPKLHMSSLNLNGICPTPAFMADSDGNTHVIRKASALDLEKMARIACVEMGSRALVALYVMDANHAKGAVVAGSVKKAIEMGQDLIDAKSATAMLVEKWGGKHLASGSIDAIDYRIEGGFLIGTLSLKRKEGRPLVLRFINEFLTVEDGTEIIAATPDILSLIEESSGKIISTADAKWGLRVDVILLPSPAVWKSQAGMELVGVDQHGF